MLLPRPFEIIMEEPFFNDNRRYIRETAPLVRNDKPTDKRDAHNTAVCVWPASGYAGMSLGCCSNQGLPHNLFPALLNK